MKKNNPWNKFFTFDLIPDNGEIGNAFWGYHVGNNIGRLLNLDGTVFFPALGTMLDKPSELYDRSVARIPIEMCQFIAAPAIQFNAQVEIPPSSGTIKFYGTWDGGVLNRDVNDYDRVIQIRYDEFWGYDSGEPYTNNFMRLGESNEVMQITGYSIENLATCSLVNFEVIRGAVGGIIGSAYEADAAAVLAYRTNNDGIIYVAPSFGESQYVVNPSFVEAFLDQNALHIFWGHDSAGTVYFKIFGI